VLAASPEKLNEDPHGAAWLIQVRVSNTEEISDLMSASDYQTYIGAES
jgi:glycine cleavage system H protein